VAIRAVIAAIKETTSGGAALGIGFEPWTGEEVAAALPSGKFLWRLHNDRRLIEEDDTMYVKTISLGAWVAWIVFIMPSAYAQRGMSEPSGVARQATKPQVVRLEGTLLSIEIGPCQHTTGHSVIGVHVILKTVDEQQLNVHLGPASSTASFVSKLTVGKPISVEAFRTAKMPANHYVAQKVVAGDATMVLRDESLRATWAGGGPRVSASGPYGRPCMQGAGGYYQRGGYHAYGRGGRGHGYRWRR
jgi:hypothetical protein